MNKNVLLLGCNGMLGSMILDVLSQERSVALSATVRNKKHLRRLCEKYPTVKFFIFDAEKESIVKILKKMKNTDWIINTIGKIKPFIHDNNAQEIEKAIAINSEFPYAIQKVVQASKIKVIQIATDCVFSGEKGAYIETDPHDALDVYGKTKSLGEVISTNFIHLRTSIIGPEKNTHNSLFAWFLNQKNKADLSGFTNHFWNGITTLHFAKICKGIILDDLFLSNLQHIIPKDIVIKQKLLQYFSKYFKREDIKITQTKAKTSINRTLSTIHGKMNSNLWKSAGYKIPPTVEEMVKELAVYMKEREL